VISPSLVLLGGVGLVAGLMIGCIGIGGVIVVPILTYLGGIPIQIAIAGAMMGYVLTGLVGTVVYAHKKSIRWEMAGWLCAGAMPAALAGAWSTQSADPLLLEFAVGALALISGVQALRGLSITGMKDQMITNPALAMIGAVTGYASAITGTGGPLVLVPILMWLQIPVLTAIGLSQAIQFPIAMLATIGNFAYGEPDLMLGVLLAVGLTIGTWAGAQVAHAVPRAVLGRFVALVLVVVGGLIFFRIAWNLIAY
jgi:uncharacterized membrane protein YfcA